jgi:ABC-type uncharacterized transport system permease subunit
MSMSDRINQANARSRRVPAAIFKVILAWFLSGIVLAILVPVLHALGGRLQAWMAWVVIVSAFALCLGPDLVRRFTNRDRGGPGRLSQ